MAEFDEKALLDGADSAFALDVKGWDDLFEDMGFKAWRKVEEGSSLNCYKSTGTMAVPPSVYFDFYKDLEYWQTWDENVEKLNEIGQEANGDVTKIYWSVKYPFPFTNRDYVYKRFAKHFPEKKVWIMCCKTYQDKDYPEGKRVRVDTYRTTIYLREKPDGTTEIVLEYFEDPKMSIPQWAINWVSSKAIPKFLEKQSEKSKAYPEYLAKKKK